MNDGAQPPPKHGWQVIGSALGAAVVLLVSAHASPPSPGMHWRVTTTVVPSDTDNLGCDSTVQMEGHHCAYAEGKPWPGPKPLKPYSTVQREVVLLSGLFEDHKVDAWLRRARTTRRAERATFKCSTVVLGEFDSVGVRWRRSEPFGKEQRILAARVEHCDP